MELVSNLILNSSQYTAGAQQAIGSNRAISGSIDSIIGQLQRQRAAFERSNLTTQDNILRSAGSGASEGQINAALQLNEEVEAQKRAKMAQDEATAAKLAAERAGQSLIASLKAEQAVMGMTTSQIQIYRLAQAGASDADIRRASAIQRDIAASAAKRASDEASTAAAIKAKEAGESLVATLEREKATFGMTAAQVRIYTATQAGASAADIQRANALNSEIAAMRAAKEAQESLNSQTSISASSQGGLSRSSMMVTEAIRGTEDAVAGYTNNGLKGMLMATTNNIGQIGALVGGLGGMLISGGAVAALIGVSLIPKMYEWATSTEEVTKRKKEMAEESKRVFDQEISQIVKLQNMRHDNIVDQQEFDRKASDVKTSSQGQAVVEDLQRQKEELNKRKEAAQTEINELRKPVPRAVSANMTAEERAQLDKSRTEKLRAAKEAEAEAIRESEKLSRQQMQMQRQIADMKITEGKRASSEAWIAEQKLLLERRNEDKKADEEAQKRRKGFVSELASQLKTQQEQAEPGLRDNQENERKKQVLAEAERRGLITAEQRERFGTTIDTKAPQQPGQSPAAVIAGSRDAFSTVARSIREAPFQKEQASHNATMKELAVETKRVLEQLAVTLADGIPVSETDL